MACRGDDMAILAKTVGEYSGRIGVIPPGCNLELEGGNREIEIRIA
jgi:hypothetical protein